jgi:hypothetical protein
MDSFAAGPDGTPVPREVAELRELRIELAPEEMNTAGSVILAGSRTGKK